MTILRPLRRPHRPKAIAMDVLARLCAYLGCQPGELLEYTPTPRPSMRRVRYTHGSRRMRPLAEDARGEREAYRAAVRAEVALPFGA